MKKIKLKITTAGFGKIVIPANSLKTGDLLRVKSNFDGSIIQTYIQRPEDKVNTDIKDLQQTKRYLLTELKKC